LRRRRRRRGERNEAASLIPTRRRARTALEGRKVYSIVQYLQYIIKTNMIYV